MPAEELALAVASLGMAAVLAYATIRLAGHTEGLKNATGKLADLTARVATIEEARDRREALRHREARYRRRLELGLKFVKPETEDAWRSSIDSRTLGAPESDDFLGLVSLVDFAADHVPELLVRKLSSFVEAMERRKFESLEPAGNYKDVVLTLRSTVNECIPRWRAEHEQAVRDLAAQDG